MWFLKKSLLGLALVVGAVGMVHAATVAPFYFESLGASSSVQPGKQQEYWESLMKYKLWGTTGITLSNEGEIRLEDTTGYNGTATGDLLLAYPWGGNYHFGGTTLIGKDVKVGSFTQAEMLGGPLRALGDLQIPSWQSGKFSEVNNVVRFDGPYCVQGAITGNGAANDPTEATWRNSVRGGVYDGDSYSSCPSEVPGVDSHLSVPKIPTRGDNEWETGINLSPSSPLSEADPDNPSCSQAGTIKVAYIHVPPDSVYTNEYGTYDKYIDKLKVSSICSFKIYVVMPPGGRLTRIFVRDGFELDNSAHYPKIQTVYVTQGTKFNRSTGEWDLSGKADFSYISNQNYAGNLLFYTTHPVNWGSTDHPSYQGSFITSSQMTIGNAFTIAGQLIAENIYIRAPFAGDFRFVPFDPPLISLDMAVNQQLSEAEGKVAGYYDDDGGSILDIKLTKTPTTDVNFKYCFTFDGVLNGDKSTDSYKAATDDVDLSGNHSLPLCQDDNSVYRIAHVAAGTRTPETDIKIWINDDGLIENTEAFQLKIWDLDGGVFGDNTREWRVRMFINDDDDLVPLVPQTSNFTITTNEDVPIIISSFPATYDDGSNMLNYSVYIETLPPSGKGVLTYNGVPVQKNQPIPSGNLNGLMYTPPADQYGNNFTTITFHLHAIPENADTETKTMTININPVNDPPRGTGCNADVYENSIKGTAVCAVSVVDPENEGGMTYEITYGNDGVALDEENNKPFAINASTGAITVNGKLNYERIKFYPLQVTVTDKQGAKTVVPVNVTILNVDENPSAKDCTGEVAENSLIGTPTGCWIEADDPEDGYKKLTYEITGGVGKELFSIDAEGNIKVNGPIDFETRSQYTLTVTVTDTKGHPTTATATINITDKNEPPVVTDVLNCSITENTKKIIEGANCKVVASDVDAGDALTYTIKEGNVSSTFSLNATTGVITALKKPNYEDISAYTLYIEVRDKGDSVRYVRADIAVRDTNEVPTGTARNGFIDENSPVGTYVDCGSDGDGNAYYCVKGQDVDANTTLTYTIVAGDPNGAFTVNSVGDILVARDIIDYESQQEYNLTIRIRDNGKPGTLKDTLYVDKSVKITVKNGNERPSVTGIPDQTIDEHTAVGTVVGTITGTDPENGALTYLIDGGNDGQVFAIDPGTGEISVAKDIDFEALVELRADTVFKLNVFVKDAEGLRSTGTVVTINIRDINEGADIENTTMTVKENEPKGTVVGTLELYDPDTKNENLQNTYQIIGGDKDLFTIDAKTGVIKTNAVFDYETKTSYSLLVRVYDQDGNADTATVTVNIADVKETSKIVVTHAETGSGAQDWNYPTGTLYTNENVVYIEWEADGIAQPVTIAENLKEGYNVVTLTYRDPAKNTGVTETVGIFVSTRTPEVTVTTAANQQTSSNIFTLVETVDESDTSVYVNKKNNDIVITVKEPVLDQSYTDSTCNYETHSFTVNTELEPVTIPSNTYDVVNKVVAAAPVLNTSPTSEVTYSQYNKDQIKVSYTEKVAGVDVTISYVTDKNGNVEKIPVIGVNGKIDSIEVMTVSYQVNVGGKVVNVSYLADAATGQALKTTTVNNPGTNSGTNSASNSGSNSGSNGGNSGSNGGNSGSNGGNSANSGSNGGNSASNGGNGSNSGTGNSAPVYMYSLTEGEVLFSVTYDFTTKVKGMGETTVQVSYTVDQKGNVTKDKDGNVGYAVSYTYVNEMGNSSTQSVYIVVDLIPPKVKIESPSNDEVLHSNMVEVKWCVDFGDGRGCVPQDSLTFEGLQPGEVNEIVRYYRDKAGNEASDVVYVMAKNTKDVDISVEKPVTSITKDDVDKYYSSKKPEEGQTFAVSIYNPQSNKEIETMVGGSFKNKEAAHDSVYPGLSGHLGPTLGIQTKVPVINSVAGLATLDDLVGADGMILLDAVEAVGSRKVTVDEFMEVAHCEDDVKSEVKGDISQVNLYNTVLKAKIWVYTSLGQFVDYFSFNQELNDPSYASDAGVLTLYFEMKPDENGDLHTDNGRLYATGAYVYKTEITMETKLRCDLPPFDGDAVANKAGQRKRVKDDLLKSFGYKRPKSK